jgi:hypothetical protein
MGIATEQEARDAMNRVTEAAIDDMEAKWDRRRAARERWRKREQE